MVQIKLESELRTTETNIEILKALVPCDERNLQELKYDSRFWTVSESADYHKVPKHIIRYLIYTNKIFYVFVKRCYYLLKAEIIQLELNYSSKLLDIPKGFMPTDEAQAELDFSKERLYYYYSRGKIEHIKKGKYVYVSNADVARLKKIKQLQELGPELLE